MLRLLKRGSKAAIISLVKYFNAMGINYFVIHDRDQGVAGAELFNAPILAAMHGDSTKRLMMEECLEDELGYQAPSSEKPYKAYQKTLEWEDSWDNVTANWKDKITTVIFPEYFQ